MSVVSLRPSGLNWLGVPLVSSLLKNTECRNGQIKFFQTIQNTKYFENISVLINLKLLNSIHNIENY